MGSVHSPGNFHNLYSVNLVLDLKYSVNAGLHDCLCNAVWNTLVQYWYQVKSSIHLSQFKAQISDKIYIQTDENLINSLSDTFRFNLAWLFRGVVDSFQQPAGEQT